MVLRSGALGVLPTQRSSLRRRAERGRWVRADGKGLLTRSSCPAQLGAGEQEPSLGPGPGGTLPSLVGIIVWGASGALPDVCLLGSIRTNIPFQAIYQI